MPLPVRTKLVIAEDLLRPRASIVLQYAGPEPERFYSEIPKLLQTIFRTPEGAIQEKNLTVSHGETKKLSCAWELVKDLDRFSYYNINVKLSLTSSKGVGNASISIDGALKTEYPQETYFEKTILYEFLRMLYTRFFYASKREEYYKEGQRLISQFVDELKAMFRGLK